MILFWLSAGAATVALLLNSWQWWVGRRFPVDARRAAVGPWPGVTLLKPLKGADAETRACLESWFQQGYPGPLQILLGVEEAADPVVGEVRRLLQAYPAVEAVLEVCPKACGLNAKVMKLARLAALARHEVLVISDADVAAPPDLVREVAGVLRDSAVGLVCSLYRLRVSQGLASRCEALAVNADFWSQVLQARACRPMDFALGATMGLRREWLSKAGGFEALKDHLADDFQLGRRIFGGGGKIELCPVVVECREGPRRSREVWAHQLRWARTIRVSRPIPYFFSVFSNGSLWALVFAGAAGIAIGAGRLWEGWAGFFFAGGCLGARMAIVGMLQGRFVSDPLSRVPCWLAPLRDLAGAGIWLAAFLGSGVTWKGQRFRVLRDGRLEPG